MIISYRPAAKNVYAVFFHSPQTGSLREDYFGLREKICVYSPLNYLELTRRNGVYKNKSHSAFL